MELAYDCDYRWGQGKIDAMFEVLDFAKNWAVNETRELYDRAIWDGMYGFVKVGVCLKNLALGKAYKKQFRTFKQFCERYLSISPGLAKQYIKATDTWLELANATTDDENGETIARFNTLPQNISQVMPLTKLDVTTDIDGNSELTDKWEQVLDYTQKVRKGKVTASAVREIVGGAPPQKGISIDDDVWDMINEAAAKEGLSKKDFIKKAVQVYLSRDKERGNPPTQEQQGRWESDLADLCDEHERENAPDPTSSEYGWSEGAIQLDLVEEIERVEKNATQQKRKVVTHKPIFALFLLQDEMEAKQCFYLKEGQAESVIAGEKTAILLSDDVYSKCMRDPFRGDGWAKTYYRIFSAPRRHGGKLIGWVKPKWSPVLKELQHLELADLQALQGHQSIQNLDESSLEDFRDRHYPHLLLGQRQWYLEFEFWPRDTDPYGRSE